MKIVKWGIIRNPFTKEKETHKDKTNDFDLQTG